MPVTIKANTAWIDSIKRNHGTVGMTLPMKVKADETQAEEVIKKMVTPDFFKEILEKFIKDKFLGPGGILYTEYKSKANELHYPFYTSVHDGKSRPAGVYDEKAKKGRKRKTTGKTKDYRYKQRVNMGEGFNALWNAIADKPVFTLEGNTAVAKIGPWNTIRGLKLNDYMGTTGKKGTLSPYNSLFYAVEYGTGVADNVGPQYVRGPGPNAPHKNPDGSWWFGIAHGEGALFTGQKGFHFLYDARTRQPREYYAQRLRKSLPAYINARLKQHGGSVEV